MNLQLIVSGLIILSGLFVFTYFKYLRKPKKIQKIWEQVQTGEIKNSIRQLKAMIIKQGGPIDAHFLLAECYRIDGNYQLALVEYRFCLKSKKKLYIGTEKEIREGIVDCALKLGREEEALNQLYELNRIEPKNDKYLFDIAKIFYKKGNLEQTVTFLDKTIKVNPTHADALSYLGMIMYHANKIKEAMLYLAKAVKYNQRNYRAYYYLGRLYMDGKDFNKAITYFDAAQRSQYYRVRSFIQKGNCYRELNEFEHAVEEYKKAITSATSKEQNLLLMARYVLADLYESKGKLTEALEQWENIYRINPSFKDVMKKLEKYRDLRADDNMKDFLVSSLPVFEGICLDIVKYLGYDIVDIKHVKSSITNIIAVPRLNIGINVRSQKVYIKIYRDVISLGLNAIKNLVDEAKSMNCVKAVCISPGEFKEEAKEYAQSRPIDLIGGSKLSKILSEVRG